MFLDLSEQLGKYLVLPVAHMEMVKLAGLPQGVLAEQGVGFPSERSVSFLLLLKPYRTRPKEARFEQVLTSCLCKGTDMGIRGLS